MYQVCVFEANENVVRHESFPTQDQADKRACELIENWIFSHLEDIDLVEAEKFLSSIDDYRTDKRDLACFFVGLMFHAWNALSFKHMWNTISVNRC